MGLTPPGEPVGCGFGKPEETKIQAGGCWGQERSEEREEGLGPKGTEAYVKEKEGREESRDADTQARPGLGIETGISLGSSIAESYSLSTRLSNHPASTLLPGAPRGNS